MTLSKATIKMLTHFADLLNRCIEFSFHLNLGPRIASGPSASARSAFSIDDACWWVKQKKPQYIVYAVSLAGRCFDAEKRTESVEVLRIKKRGTAKSIV